MCLESQYSSGKLKRILNTINGLFHDVCNRCGVKVHAKQDQIEHGPVRMINHINITGVHSPEKLAEGVCPKCRTMLDLWLTSQGLEMSLSSNRGDASTPNN